MQSNAVIVKAHEYVQCARQRRDRVSQCMQQCLNFIDEKQIYGVDSAYAKVTFVAGQDWSIADGIDQVVTQLGFSHAPYTIGSSMFKYGWIFALFSHIWGTTRADSTNSTIVWACPLGITYKSTNMFGWPQVTVAVYGMDTLGRDVALGYAAVRIPRHPGR